MISVKDIGEIENRRRLQKREIYKVIYAQFSNRIKTSVEMKQNYARLNVPVFVIGFPSFDIIQAAIYLKRQLERGGFTVQTASPTEFIVTWKIKRKTTKRGGAELGNSSLLSLKKTADRYRKY